MFLHQAERKLIYMEDGAADIMFQVSKKSKKVALTINSFKPLTIFTKRIDHIFFTGF